MTTLPTATPHKSFSLARVYTIASNTVLELIRLKVFFFILIFALIVFGFSLSMVKLSFQEQIPALKHLCLGAMTLFTWLLGLLSTAMLLPKDIEERTLYTILAKPVPRFEYLLGKLLGVFALLFLALTLMIVMFVAVLYRLEWVALQATMKEYPPGPDLEAALQQVRDTAFTANLAPGIVIIYLKAAVCATLTLLISTFASSSIFTVVVSVMTFIIGHVQPIARDYVMTQKDASPLTVSYMSLVALLMPDLRAFDLLDDLATKISPELFAQTAGLGALYITIYFFVAYFIFAGKEL
jgi:hypothetical protein